MDQPNLNRSFCRFKVLYDRNLFFIYCGLFVLILVVFVLFLLLQRFGQISPLAFFRWFPRIGMQSLVTVSPVITGCCLSHQVFDQVNLWPAWVGFETAIFWQYSLGTVETQRLYPLRHYKSNYLFSLSGLLTLIWSSIVESVPNL